MAATTMAEGDQVTMEQVGDWCAELAASAAACCLICCTGNDAYCGCHPWLADTREALLAKEYRRLYGHLLCCRSSTLQLPRAWRINCRVQWRMY